jgi:prepilin-type N-terminal cleavage/methylation domain-containing protein
MWGRREGFTLIELLIVVVIIGILAAIAIPRFSATREKAYFAAMESDLKNIQAQEELYYSSANRYTYAPDATTAGLGFTPSSGVTVSVSGASQAGWAATATHAALSSSSQYCTVAVGDTTLLSGVLSTGLGVVQCTGE